MRQRREGGWRHLGECGRCFSHNIYFTDSGQYSQVYVTSLVSFHLRDVRQLPCLLKERLVRAVEAEEWKPTFAGHRGNPVRLLTLRRLRAGVEIHRAVGVALHLLVVGVQAGTRCFADEAARFVIVNSEGPELLRGHVGGYTQSIGVLAAQRLALCIEKRLEIEGGGAELRRRRVKAEEADAARIYVEVLGSFPFESRFGGDQGRRNVPLAIGPETLAVIHQPFHEPGVNFVARLLENDSCCGVGLESLALLDAKRAQ